MKNTTNKNEISKGKKIVLFIMITIIIFTIFFISVFTYWKVNYEKVENSSTDVTYYRTDTTPNITVFKNNNENYHYIVDNSTGVVYLEYKYLDKQFSITPMFNPDGSMVTAEQVGLDYNKD